ncbi:MAG: arginine deiminase-related protein [Flavobacteriaceae bacterium]|nr:arginine deiminase-related protein [Flavobacteriaceae bacterium]MDG1031774.1 arginine deiminase-related protein [Flavobacteriaceae bacterium]MDG1343956.1 arginine deiminase-related protein [Flavobacteriaceae bacterium]MDG1792310.1 arginine deiminase-related protein [Flavobacteriaceae bacterium]MDG2485203.1 arginine deiminase-related protein [Flavobacteriaceae bacterium]
MNNIHSILMVRPSSFRMNSQTASNNYFQKITDLNDAQVLEKACLEFDNLVSLLLSNGIPVNVFQDDLVQDTPDSIFPNNWISFHSKKRIAIYPMYAHNRRLERNDKIIKFIENKGIKIDFINDYSEAENHNFFLEGTGSMVLDRLNKKSYCSLSERTSESLVEEFCDEFNYMPIIFKSYQSIDKKRKLIYHTNVMMCIANKYSIICLDSVDSKIDKQILLKSLKDDNKEIIEISENQLNSFAGNMIELVFENNSFLVMSSQAYKSLTKNQINKIEKFSKIIHSNVETIENCGGGSVRCMIAEVFN